MGVPVVRTTFSWTNEAAVPCPCYPVCLDWDCMLFNMIWPRQNSFPSTSHHTQSTVSPTAQHPTFSYRRPSGAAHQFPGNVYQPSLDRNRTGLADSTDHHTVLPHPLASKIETARAGIFTDPGLSPRSSEPNRHPPVVRGISIESFLSFISLMYPPSTRPKWITSLDVRNTHNNGSNIASTWFWLQITLQQRQSSVPTLQRAFHDYRLPGLLFPATRSCMLFVTCEVVTIRAPLVPGLLMPPVAVAFSQKIASFIL